MKLSELFFKTESGETLENLVSSAEGVKGFPPNLSGKRTEEAFTKVNFYS